MDTPAALPPSPSQEPPAYVAAAAGDIYPRNRREEELCSIARQPDWLYMGALLALDAGSIYLASEQLKYQDSLVLRSMGPFLIGLTWGPTLSGAHLSLPKCSYHWVEGGPPEGAVHSQWPLAFATALFAGATAPLVLGIAQGPNFPTEWNTTERAMRLVVAGVTAFGSSFIPYLLPPRSYRAARELDRIRAGGDGQGAFVSYTVRF